MLDTIMFGKNLFLLVTLYAVGVNLVAFVMYGWDKYKAKNNQWRTSEKSLFYVAVLGGSIGALIGMYYFRHKTQHWYFKFGIPFILFVQIVALILVMWYFAFRG